MLLGFVITVGGCVPFGIAINNAVNVNEVFSNSISVNKHYTSQMIKVDSRYSVLPAIKIHLSTDEIDRRSSDSFNDEYQAKYRFPIQITITNTLGKDLYHYNGNLNWSSGTRNYKLNNVNSRHGEVIVEIDLKKISVPVPGEIKVSVLLKDDQFYYAKIHSAQLVVYDNVHQHMLTILTGVVIVIFGIIIFIIGLVMLILKQTETKQTETDLKKDTANMNNDNKEINTNNSSNSNSNQSSINTTAMLCHLSTFAGLIIPFGGILGPLIVWQIKKDEDPFINRHGIAALNFHLSMAIYYFVGFLLAFVVVGFFVLAVLAVTELVLIIIASIKASNGEEYQYPLAIRFIKVQE